MAAIQRVAAPGMAAPAAPPPPPQMHQDICMRKLIWVLMGSIASVLGYLATFSTSFGSPVKKVFTLSYDVTIDARHAMNVPGLRVQDVGYLTGRWDVVTLIGYTCLLFVWQSCLSFAIEKFLRSRHVVRPEFLSRTIVSLFYYSAVVYFLVRSMAKGPFSRSLIWSGYDQVLPYSAKMGLLFQMAYMLSGLAYGFLFRDDPTYTIPNYKEVIYTVIICATAYVSRLIPFAYLLLLPKAIFEIFMYVDLIHETVAVNQDRWKICEYISLFGSVAAHVGFFILTILLCCWAPNASRICKALVMALTVISLSAEITYFVLNITDTDNQQQPPPANRGAAPNNNNNRRRTNNAGGGSGTRRK